MVASTTMQLDTLSRPRINARIARLRKPAGRRVERERSGRWEEVNTSRISVSGSASK